MSFLAGAFLFSLAGLVIPILIALWNRRHMKKEKFGGFYILRKVSESMTRRIRLFEILKLLNRLALISFLVMVFAEPFQILRRIGDAEQGFMILLDAGRSMQLSTREGRSLAEMERERLTSLLQALPSETRGILGFVSNRCDFAQGESGQLTATPGDWLKRIDSMNFPYSNLKTSSFALSSCVAKANAIFKDKEIFRVFISALPDSLEMEDLKKLPVKIEQLPAPQIEKSEIRKLSQELRQQSLRIQMLSDKKYKASIISQARLEPLGDITGFVDLPPRDSSFLVLEDDSIKDPWGSVSLHGLQSILSQNIFVWAAEETPGFLSLISALRNHPTLKVTKQVGESPQAEPVIVYGNFNGATESLGRSLFFLNPDGQSSIPYRDKKALQSLSVTNDLLKAFQFRTEQGSVLVRRYVLLDPDRFESLAHFEDGAPLIYQDKKASSRHWFVPFDLEDLTTDLRLESSFIPFLYAQVERWLGEEQEGKLGDRFEPVWLFPGASKPADSVIAKLEWPGLYQSKARFKIIEPISAPENYLKFNQDLPPSAEIDEKISWRHFFQKALVFSAILEFIFCLASLPNFLLGSFLGLSLLFGGEALIATELREVPLGAGVGIDKDRLEALRQLTIEMRSLSNLDFAKPEVLEPKNFWKSSLVVFSSTKALAPWSLEEQQAVRDYCERGGLLFFDDPLAVTGSVFYESIQRELAKVFPGRGLKAIPKEDVIYRSYYLLNEVSGRKLASPYLEGIDFDRRWVVVFSANDLLGANFKSASGDYAFSVTPYGLSQRSLAERLFLNVMMYSVTLDYKDDAIHLPHILKKRVR